MLKLPSLKISHSFNINCGMIKASYKGLVQKLKQKTLDYSCTECRAVILQLHSTS